MQGKKKSLEMVSLFFKIFVLILIITDHYWLRLEDIHQERAVFQNLITLLCTVIFRWYWSWKFWKEKEKEEESRCIGHGRLRRSSSRWRCGKYFTRPTSFHGDYSIKPIFMKCKIRNNLYTFIFNYPILRESNSLFFCQNSRS